MPVVSVARGHVLTTGGTMRSFFLALLLSPCALAQDSFLDELRLRNARHDDVEAQDPDVSVSESIDADLVSEDGEAEDAFEQIPSRRFRTTGYEDVELPDSESFEGSRSVVADAICAEQQLACGPTPELTRFRKGSYQGSSVAAGYIYDDPSTGIAMTTLDVSTVFAVPLGSFDNLLILTPYVRADLLDPAPALDVPDAVYDTGLKAFWRKPINDRWSAMFLFTPSMRTDFESTSGVFRIFGLGLLIWQAIPDNLSVSGGVVYTGRDDFPVLPGMGLLWTPSPDWRYDIQFPSPSISHRIQQDPGQSETWLYLGGVFGGNTWSVRRPSGTDDELTISDLRLVLGAEKLWNENRAVFGEVGYVFNRSFEYASLPAETELDSSWMLRAGVSF